MVDSLKDNTAYFADESASLNTYSAESKKTQLWTQLLSRKSDGDVENQLWPDFVDISRNIGSSNCNYIMDSTDESRDSSKVLCTHGFVACIKIEWRNGGNFTGLFRKSTSGIIRLSSALKSLE